MTIEKDIAQFDNFDFRVAMGFIKGATRVGKFAKATVGSTEQDLWNRSHDLTYLTTPATLYAISTSASDTMTIEVSGISDTGEYKNEKIQLTGTTSVQLLGTWIRVWRVKLIESMTANAGEIFVSTSATTPINTEIQAYIAAGEKQTYMSHFTVPKGYVGLFKSYTASTGQGKEATIIPELRNENYVFLPATEDRRFQTVFQNATYYFPIPPEYDIRIRCLSEASGTRISFPYTLYLVPIQYWEFQPIQGQYIENGVIQE